MNTQNRNQTARVEIDRLTLSRLLGSGQLKVCELHCLDSASKQLLRQLCLDSCAQCPLLND
jgi:hypothetical protein